MYVRLWDMWQSGRQWWNLPCWFVPKWICWEILWHTGVSMWNLSAVLSCTRWLLVQQWCFKVGQYVCVCLVISGNNINEVTHMCISTKHDSHLSNCHLWGLFTCPVLVLCAWMFLVSNCGWCTLHAAPAQRLCSSWPVVPNVKKREPVWLSSSILHLLLLALKSFKGFFFSLDLHPYKQISSSTHFLFNSFFHYYK